jgi:hypothetical protein
MELAWAVGSGSPTGTCFLTFSQDHNQTQLHPLRCHDLAVSFFFAACKPRRPATPERYSAMLIPCCDAVLPCSQHGLPYHRLSLPQVACLECGPCSSMTSHEPSYLSLTYTPAFPCLCFCLACCDIFLFKSVI